jgi:hypothetical protein
MAIRLRNALLKKAELPSAPAPTTEELVALLKRAASELQDMQDGDMNNALAMEIEEVLKRMGHSMYASSKKAYGYDVSGQVQEGSGSQGNQKNVQDNSTGNATDGHGSPKNPANYYTDDTALAEFPELNRPSKVRFLPPRGLK